VLLTLFTGGLPDLSASSNKWTSIGPFGGSVQALAIDPKNPVTLYAGTNSGIFKSTDAGATWNAINPAISVMSLAIDPRNPDTLYAGSYGVFKSIDGGDHWIAASSGLPKAFAGRDASNAPYSNVLSFAIDPQNPSTLYTGTQWGVYKTVDGGANWMSANDGLPTLPVSLGVSLPINAQRLIIDPQNPNTVYTLIGSPWQFGNGSLACCSSAVFKTTDGGVNWSALSPPVQYYDPFNMPSPISTIAMDPQNSKTIYAADLRAASLFKSVDGGANWSTVNSKIVSFNLAVDPQSSNTLYASTPNGFFKSTDAGTNWTATLELPQSVGAFAIDPQSPTTLYVSSWPSGLFKTNDAGVKWTVANSGLSTLSVATVAVDPQNSDLVYASTGWMGSIARSADGGSSWSSLTTTLPNFYPFVLAIDPLNPKTLYAGTNAGDFGPAGLIFKSVDRGVTWGTAISGLPEVLWSVNALAINPKNPNTILAGTDKGVFKSIDAGATWNESSIGLTGPYINALAIDPQTTTTVYALSSEGVFKSLDGGTRWGALDLPIKAGAGVLAIDPKNPSTVYAGSDKRLFKSTDGGTSWTSSISGLPTDQVLWMSSLVIDPQNPSTLYIGFSGAWLDSCEIPCSGFNDGVYKSIDGGTTWTAVNSGFSMPHVTSLAIDPQNPNRLYAATLGGGVFATNFGPAPLVTDFRFDRTSVIGGGSFSVTALGSNLTPQIFFDVRITAPGSSTSSVVLNWQKGSVATHDVPSDIIPGTWTITGVRAHEFEAEHSDSFIPITTTITVVPGKR